MTPAARADQDRLLADQLLAGVPDALERVLKEIGPRVMLLLERRFGSLLDRADLEDALAAALARLWFERAQYDPAKAGLETWFYLLARNAAVDAHRRRRVRATSLEAGEELSSRPPSGEPAPGPPAPLRQALERAIAELSPREQRILYAYVDAPDGNDWAAPVAAELGLRTSHVRVLRLRAVQKLRHRLLDTLAKPSRRENPRGHHL